MRIREIRKADIKEVSSLITKVVLNNFSSIYSDKIIKYFCKQNSVKNIVKKINNGVKYFVVEDKNKIVGVAGVKKNEIVSFHISVEHQKCGIGKRLMLFIKNVYAKKNLVKKLKVHSSPPAVGFYQKCGFKVVKETTHTTPNGDRYTTVLMECQIF